MPEDQDHKKIKMEAIRKYLTVGLGCFLLGLVIGTFILPSEDCSDEEIKYIFIEGAKLGNLVKSRGWTEDEMIEIINEKLRNEKLIVD